MVVIPPFSCNQFVVVFFQVTLLCAAWSFEFCFVFVMPLLPPPPLRCRSTLLVEIIHEKEMVGSTPKLNEMLMRNANFLAFGGAASPVQQEQQQV